MYRRFSYAHLLGTSWIAFAIGCGSYDERPYAKPVPPQIGSEDPPTATEGAPAEGTDPASIPAVDEAQAGAEAANGETTERTRLSELGVKRVPLENVVGVYLNAKVAINSRLLAINAHQVAEQFKAINDRYPNDYAELEVQLKNEGKELPELQAGHRYVFDPSDGQVYVEND